MDAVSMTASKQITDGLVEAIPEDRDAAWPFRPEGYGPIDRPAWDSGVCDHNRMIQAFARHRLNAVKAETVSYAERVDYEERVLRAEMEAIRLRRFLASRGWVERLTPMCCIEGGTDVAGCSCVNPKHELAFYNVGKGQAAILTPETNNGQ